jgi:hypothetical protein
MMNDVSAKKRLMYLSGEDFYLYCYSVFVILASLGCCNGRYFRDYRKLAFLVDIIRDEKTTYVVSRSSDSKLNSKDYEQLLESHSTGLTLRSEILKLLFVLEKRGYVSLVRGKADEINISLNKDNLHKDFFDKKRFDSEYKNISRVAEKVKRLASLTLETMLTKIYVENGVRSWV